MKKYLLLLVLGTLATGFLFSQTLPVVAGLPPLEKLNITQPGNPKDTTPTFVALQGSNTPVLVQEDTDGDGRADYGYTQDRRGRKILEAYDFNADGQWDDFYLYKDGILDRREVDSNFDGKIDLWVYLYKGNYMRAWERDLDFDGIVDKVKEY